MSLQQQYAKFEGVEAKLCKKCLTVKAVTDFYVKPVNKDGREGTCIACFLEANKLHYKNNTKHRLALSRKWYQAHADYNASRITGNWEIYFARLITSNSNRRNLTVSQLLKILKRQDYRCALTGEEMTCIRGQGNVPTNASMDRISAGGEYTIDNIQLVCRVINHLRGNNSVLDFINWCQKVADHSRRIT